MPAQRTLIKASHIIAHDGVKHRHLRDGVVVLEGDTIVFVGRKFEGTTDNVIDATGRIAAPGFIDTHIHMAGSPLDKSFVEDHGKRNFFNSGLFEMLPARSAGQDTAANHACVEFSMLELLHTGTTTALELGPVPEYTAEQAARFGLRTYVGPMYRSGRWHTDDGRTVKYAWDEAAGMAAFERAVAWIAKNDGTHGGLVKGLLSPSQVDTCSEALLRRTREAGTRLRVPVTLHVSQSVNEFHEMVRRHGCSPIEWLRDIGFLAPEVILGHAIILAGGSWAQYAGDDIGVMAESGCSVAHAPWVFARRGIAMESFSRYLKAGINLSLGTDTAPQSMIEAMKFAAVVSKIIDRQTETATAADVFNAATLGGAKAIGRDDLGRIARGAKADLVIWEGESLWMSPLRDPVKNIVFSAQAADVNTVIVNGRVVLRDGAIPGAPDIKAMARKLQQSGERVWANIARGDWAGRDADALSPQSFEGWDGEEPGSKTLAD
ncbi:MAG: amidohydrolase family protein [Betaproteobacteria bacterium]|nr:amidohydrolase family protein [Betaproteobacteria bacterium]